MSRSYFLRWSFSGTFWPYINGTQENAAIFFLNHRVSRLWNSHFHYISAQIPNSMSAWLLKKLLFRGFYVEKSQFIAIPITIYGHIL